MLLHESIFGQTSLMRVSTLTTVMVITVFMQYMLWYVSIADSFLLASNWLSS